MNEGKRYHRSQNPYPIGFLESSSGYTALAFFNKTCTKFAWSKLMLGLPLSAGKPFRSFTNWIIWAHSIAASVAIACGSDEISGAEGGLPGRNSLGDFKILTRLEASSMERDFLFHSYFPSDLTSFSSKELRRPAIT
jgi:hypothetical protein